MFAEYMEILLMFVKAFLVGGLICMIAQIVINFTDLTAGKILVYFYVVGRSAPRLGAVSVSRGFRGSGRDGSHFGLWLSVGQRSNPRRGKGAFRGLYGCADRGQRRHKRGGDFLVYHGADIQIEEQKELRKIKRQGAVPAFFIIVVSRFHL